jgi:acyl-CoA thioesterase
VAGQEAGGPAGEFERDTRVTPCGGHAYSATLHPAWWGGLGPHGGYLAVIMQRAIRASLPDDPPRKLRSLTVHYLSAAAPGEITVLTTIERAGRTVTTVSARCLQGTKLVALALAALATDYPPATTYSLARMPDVPPFEQLPPLPPDPDAPTVAFRFARRHAFGPAELSGGDEPRAGGWIGLEPPRPIDELSLIMCADGWWPSPESLLDHQARIATIDLTLHFWDVPRPADPHVLMEVSSVKAEEGFFVEDARLFSADGVLLLEGRQRGILTT